MELVVTSSSGATDMDTVSVEVFPGSDADISVDKTSGAAPRRSTSTVQDLPTLTEV